MAGFEPALDAVSPNAGGGGLVDIAVRSSQAGVPQAVLLPVLGPFVVGCMGVDDHQRPITEGDRPSCFGSGEGRARLAPGELELAFMLNNNARQLEVPFATLRGVRAGDWVELENLSSGEVRRRRVSARGTLMVSVAADALTGPERRGVLGLRDGDSAPVAPSSVLALGDGLVLRHFSGADGEAPRDPVTGEMDTEVRLEATPLAVVERFEREVVFQGAVYGAGQPLVALQEGLGLERNDPRFRRFMGLAQTAIGPGDPAIWSPHASLEPLEVSYGGYGGGHTRVLHMPTVGDQQVPVNTGVAAARAGGVLGSWLRDEGRFPDPRYGWRELFQPLSGVVGAAGRSADQLLIDRFVVEGDASLGRFDGVAREAGLELVADAGRGESLAPFVLFDIDDVSDGEARFSCGDDDWSAMNGESGCTEGLRASGGRVPVPYLPGGLRVTVAREGGGADALRIPLLRPAGQHGIYNAQPFRPFDADAFMVNFTTRYLGTRGERVDHLSGCDCSASLIPSYSLNGAPTFPMRGGRACGEGELRVCDAACAEGWGIASAPQVECVVP
jgi:hypothetical protein